MKYINKLPAKSLAGKPGRTAALILLAALLAFATVAGSFVIISLRRGLDSLEARMGADVIVVPYDAKTKFDVNTFLLQGNPGYFYMDKSYLDKIAALDGVESVSAQLYLASVSASCCSARVQIVGFDPDTDFTIQPWIKSSYSGDIGFGDLVVGSNIEVPYYRQLRFYGYDCNVVAQLAETGTELDNAVYGNSDTVKRLITASEEKGLNLLSNINPDNLISSILVRVADGYDAEDITNYINIHVRRVVAVQSKSMISGVADSLGGISRIVGILIGGIFVLCITVLAIAFTMIINERKKEFAILRVLGVSRSRLARMVVAESVIITLCGAVAGTALALLILYPFSTAIEGMIGLPFLMPDVGQTVMIALIAIVGALIVGMLISSWTARRISRIDAGATLREGN